MKRIRLSIVISMMLAASLLIGCSERTEIKSIWDDTAKYMQKKVSIGGTITRSYTTVPNIPGQSAYRVDDGTGEIWVLTRTGAPSMGKKVGVKGIVTYGATIDGHTWVAVIQEVERLTR